MVSEYQKDVKASQNTGNKGYDGTNPPITIDNLLQRGLISKFFATPKNLLHEYIPIIKGVRPTAVYKVLLVIGEKPGITFNHLQIAYNIRDVTIKLSLGYLLELGYIIQIGKPRFIIPFQKYKIEKGYKITSKGETVLNKLLNY